jgi:hypothetical protein
VLGFYQYLAGYGELVNICEVAKLPVSTVCRFVANIAAAELKFAQVKKGRFNKQETL